MPFAIEPSSCLCPRPKSLLPSARKLEFSPDEVLSFLLANKQSAGQEVDNVDTWVTMIKEERKEPKSEV